LNCDRALAAEVRAVDFVIICGNIPKRE